MDMLHVHGQSRWHDDIRIIGTVGALKHLQELISQALSAQEQGLEIGVAHDNDPNKECSFTSDGEGYFTTVICLPETDKRWDSLAMPYTDSFACNIENHHLFWINGKGFVRADYFSQRKDGVSNVV